VPHYPASIDFVGRRLERLTLDSLEELPQRCRECVFWELDPVRRMRACGHEEAEKQAWLSHALREWGSVGQVLHVDDEYAGHVIWAPAVLVPGANGFATAPVSPDAILLVTMWVEPRYRGAGLGRVMIQSMAKELIRHGGIRAVEAFADTRGRAGSCTVPADFLLAVGFATHRAHVIHPRMRMELRSTISWRGELEAALERLVPRRRPHPAVRPAPRALSRP
jgi:GNAT superfamily N-acetyltransferase